MFPAHQTLSIRWRAAGYEPANANAAEATVQSVERRYGVSLPEDFRLYLLHAAPKEELWDDGNGNWWPPDAIKSIPEEYPHAVNDAHIAQKAGKYLFFSDYMIWCWAWAICCDVGEDRGKVALIGGTPDRVVARSFSEFVEAYVRDPLSVS